MYLILIANKKKETKKLSTRRKQMAFTMLHGGHAVSTILYFEERVQYIFLALTQGKSML
jgi:hypothetical protein